MDYESQVTPMSNDLSTDHTAQSAAGVVVVSSQQSQVDSNFNANGPNNPSSKPNWVWQSIVLIFSVLLMSFAAAAWGQNDLMLYRFADQFLGLKITDEVKQVKFQIKWDNLEQIGEIPFIKFSIGEQIFPEPVKAGTMALNAGTTVAFVIAIVLQITGITKQFLMHKHEVSVISRFGRAMLYFTSALQMILTVILIEAFMLIGHTFMAIEQTGTSVKLLIAANITTFIMGVVLSLINCFCPQI